MTSRLEELARRKQALIMQCAREREEIAAFCRRCRIPFVLGTTLLSVGNMLKAHPLLIAALSGLLITSRGRGIAGAGMKLLGFWKTILPLRSWWAKHRAGRPAARLATPSARMNRS